MKDRDMLEILKNSKHTVVLSGAGLMAESNYPLLRDGDESYDIEEEYGYSFEEILSSSFYATRKETFFRFYKEVILDKVERIPPGPGYKSLKKLQDFGMIQTIITRRIAALEKRAGCDHVIELRGSVAENACPTCGKHYPIRYIRESKGVPLCEKCLTTIRPQICLFGEMIDNSLMTKAAEEVAKADVLLVLGSSLHTPLCSLMLQYYTGTKLILVTDTEHYSDQQADIVVYGRSDTFLSQLVTEYEKKLELEKKDE